MTEPLLQADDLTVVFPGRSGPVRAVDHVSLSIGQGETLGLVGESGSGKSTTGRAILRLQKTESGTVRLRGTDLTTLSGRQLRQHRRHMQFVLQNPYTSLNPRRRIGDAIAEPIQLFNSVPAAQVRARVAELLELVGLDPAMASRYPHEFSGGQRQRVVIARALSVNPDLVVCDEPVSALDVQIQAQIVELLQQLQQELGLAYLFIAHDLAVVKEISHRVAVMLAGRIVEIASAEELYRDPRHPYTEMLLDAVPVPDPKRQRASLAEPFTRPGFVEAGRAVGACQFGQDHGDDDGARLHEVTKGHWVSCDYWAVATDAEAKSSAA